MLKKNKFFPDFSRFWNELKEVREVIAHLRSPGSERTIVMWIFAGEGDILAFFLGG